MLTNRWIALAIIFLSFLQLTLNWFAVVPGFGGMIAEMHLSLPQIGLIVSAFIAGYGLAHIPGGLIAARWGIRFALLFGIALETIGAAISARAPGFETLLVGRFIAGAGGSIYIGAAIGLTTAWFREHELVTATGLITGVAFALGAAIGLYGWGPIVAAAGWRGALMWGAGVGAVSFAGMLLFYPTPPGGAAAAEGAHHLSVAALKRVFGNRDLWIMGFAFLGGYGAYFTAVELMPQFAASQLHASAPEAGLLGAVMLLAGIPGSYLGGWLADKVFGLVPTFLGALFIEGVALLLVPHLGIAALMVAGAAVGGIGILGFVAWISLPGLYKERIHLSDIPTAVGLMFTIAAIGGVVVPALYARIAGSMGYGAGWTLLGALTIVLSLLSLAVRRPSVAPGAVAQQA